MSVTIAGGPRTVEYSVADGGGTIDDDDRGAPVWTTRNFREACESPRLWHNCSRLGFAIGVGSGDSPILVRNSDNVG